jgi:hypothetical protein
MLKQPSASHKPVINQGLILLIEWNLLEKNTKFFLERLGDGHNARKGVVFKKAAGGGRNHALGRRGELKQ